MAKRFKVRDKRGAAKKFRRQSSRTNVRNVSGNPMRGGIRL